MGTLKLTNHWTVVFVYQLPIVAIGHGLLNFFWHMALYALQGVPLIKTRLNRPTLWILWLYLGHHTVINLSLENMVLQSVQLVVQTTLEKQEMFVKQRNIYSHNAPSPPVVATPYAPWTLGSKIKINFCYHYTKKKYFELRKAFDNIELHFTERQINYS